MFDHVSTNITNVLSMLTNASPSRNECASMLEIGVSKHDSTNGLAISNEAMGKNKHTNKALDCDLPQQCSGLWMRMAFHASTCFAIGFPEFPHNEFRASLQTSE